MRLYLRLRRPEFLRSITPVLFCGGFAGWKRLRRMRTGLRMPRVLCSLILHNVVLLLLLLLHPIRYPNTLD